MSPTRDVDADFTAFVAARSPALSRLAFLLTADEATADDLLQTALLRSYLRWSKVREHPEAYVRRVLVTVAVEDRRRPWRREIAWAQPPEAADPRDATAGVDELDAMQRVLAGLPARQRAAVVLRHAQGLSVAQTAELLGCSEGTVRSQASRGLDKLRTALSADPTSSGGQP